MFLFYTITDGKDLPNNKIQLNILNSKIFIICIGDE